MTADSRTARIAWRTRHLAAAASALAGNRGAAAGALIRRLLALPLDGEGPAAVSSRLNNDGTPLQLCFTAGTAGANLRLIADPAAHLGPEARYQSQVRTLREALVETGSSALSPLAEQTLSLLVPETEEARARYSDGFIWVAASAGRPGLAFYVEAAPLGQQGGWEVTARWLRQVLPTAGPALAAIDRLRDLCRVASFGIEGSCPQDARAKIYFRLARPMALRELGLDSLVSEEMNRFMTMAMGQAGVDLDGLVMSVGFHLATGELADAKVDLCGHCLSHDAAGWLALADGLQTAFGLQPIPLREALSLGCEVAFIGFGLDTARQARLNLYLKPGAIQGPPGREELFAAVDDAAGYLRGLQGEDGGWTDYRLPVGASDQWVTAYVGLALAQCGLWLQREPAVAASRRGAQRLMRDRTYPAGWGYNGRTGPDADSTAMTVALLDTLGAEVPAGDRAFLRRQWRPEGGMATYEGPQAWGHAHWDVTPWGYLGLGPGGREELRQSFERGLHANRTPDGLWRAYWWRRPFYSTFLTLEVLSELGLPEPALPVQAPTGPVEIDNAFDLACWIGIQHFRGAPPERMGRYLRALLAMQRPDGRWPGHPNLRVTDETCEAPWEKPVGDYYLDEAATITTATVLRVLSHVLRGPRTSGSAARPAVSAVPALAPASAPAPAAVAQARLFFKETCPPCRALSRLAVAFSLGTMRRVPLGSEEAGALHRRHPHWRGQLLLIDGDRVHLGPEVFRAVPGVIARACWRGLRRAVRGLNPLREGMPWAA